MVITDIAKRANEESRIANEIQRERPDLSRTDILKVVKKTLDDHGYGEQFIDTRIEITPYP